MHSAEQLCAKAGSAAGSPPLDRNCCRIGGDNPSSLVAPLMWKSQVAVSMNDPQDDIQSTSESSR